MAAAASSLDVASTSASTVSPRPLLSVLFYDDRYNESRDRSQPIYRALDQGRVPFVVGPAQDAFESGAISASDGQPGDGITKSHVLRYRPSAKVEWAMQTLPLVSSEFVFLLDTDTIWLCDAEEVIQKRTQLIRELSASDNSVLVFGEKGMWPPHQEFRGVHLRLNQTAGYPPHNRTQPFRYINAGAALGRPRDVLALHQCMAERYAGFPNACPAGHGPDGQLRYYAANRSWQPPVLNRPLHSRDLKYHGLRLKGSNWGWEQGCFHMYYLEYLNGELPGKCPPIVLDCAGKCMVHLAGVQQHRLAWSKQAPARVTLKENGAKPGVLHANGPAKKAFRPLQRWWDDPSKYTPSWH
jgi:hypothetical protein